MLAYLGELLLKIVILLGVGIGLKEAWNRLLTPNGKQEVVNFLTNVMGGLISVAKPVLAAAETELAPIAQAFRQAIQDFGAPILEDVTDAISPMAKTAFTAAAGGLIGGGVSTPGNAIDQAAKAMADAFGFGIGSAAVTAAFEATFPKSLNTLNGMGPMLGKLAGFDEVSAHVRAPLYRHAFGLSLDYHFANAFKAQVPSIFDAAEWRARGIIDDAQMNELFGYAGLKPQWEQSYVTARYRPISPFILTRAMEMGVISADQVRQVMTFAGIRPADQDVMISAYEALALQPYEMKVVAAAERAFQMGDINESEFSAAVAPLHLPAGAESYLVESARYGKLVQLTDMYRKSVSEGYQYGTISDADYLSTMEAAGIAAPDAEAHYAVDSIKKHGKDAIAAARAEARAEALQQRAEVKAATASYIAQQIDAAAFSAALVAAGLSEAIVPFALQVATLRRDGRKVSVYGRLVTHGEAILLREEVSQIKERVIKKLLAPEQAYRELLAQSMPTLNAQALVEAWAAQEKEPWSPPPA